MQFLTRHQVFNALVVFIWACMSDVVFNSGLYTIYMITIKDNNIYIDKEIDIYKEINI